MVAELAGWLVIPMEGNNWARVVLKAARRSKMYIRFFIRCLTALVSKGLFAKQLAGIKYRKKPGKTTYLKQCY
jgi:hypothetical protein